MEDVPPLPAPERPVDEISPAIAANNGLDAFLKAKDATGRVGLVEPETPAPELENDVWCEKTGDQSGDWKQQYVDHAKNFLDCVKSRKTPNSDLASSHWVSTTCHLANLSLRTGRKIFWDAAANDIHGDQEASGMLTRPYRAPWDKELKTLLG